MTAQRSPGGQAARHRAAAVLIAFLVAVESLTVACVQAATAPAGSSVVAAPASAASASVEPTPYKRKPWPSPTATPRLPSAADVYPGVEARIVEAQLVELPFGDVGYMGVSADSVWAETANGLIRIDPDDMSAVTVDDRPGFGMFATESSVWVSDFDGATVTRFDPKTGSPGVVAKVYGNPNAISVFGDTLWVAEHRGGAVARLEEPSGSVVAEIKVGHAGHAGPQGVTATADAVWVGIPNTGAVVRIDPATNTVVATIPVTTSPCGGIAATENAIWVSSCFDDEKVIRIDPQSNQVVGEFPIGGHNGGAVVVNGYPWFPVGNRLVRFNPATNEVDGVVEFADRFLAYGTAIGFDSVWVGGSGTVARIPIAALEDWATP